MQRADTGFCKWIYAKYFLSSLVPKIIRNALVDPHVVEMINLDSFKEITTIREFVAATLVQHVAVYYIFLVAITM